MIFNYTKEEYETVIERYFDSVEPVVLNNFPAKEKRKFIALQLIKTVFETGKIYTEKEVSEILRHVYPDYATLRRYLVDYKYLVRKPDGSAYWVYEEE